MPFFLSHFYLILPLDDLTKAIAFWVRSFSFCVLPLVVIALQLHTHKLKPYCCFMALREGPGYTHGAGRRAGSMIPRLPDIFFRLFRTTERTLLYAPFTTFGGMGFFSTLVSNTPPHSLTVRIGSNGISGRACGREVWSLLLERITLHRKKSIPICCRDRWLECSNVHVT